MTGAYASQNATAASYFAESIAMPEPPSARPSAFRHWVIGGIGGSAGLAAVLVDQAALFVDGRYTLQVRDQYDANLFTFRHISD